MSQILYVTGQSITLYTKSRSGVELQDRFTCDEAGYSSLRTTLSAGSANPIAILVDLIEEEFREESLPHTLGRDRSRLHARHAGKLFRSTPFRSYRVVGRQKSGRRDDQVLFTALTNRDNIEPLLNVLHEVGIPVSGIHSLPVLTRCLLKPMGVKNNHALIISSQPDGGLRETFLRSGKVHFSRLAPVSEKTLEDYWRLVSSEAQKTQRYLHTLRLLGYNEPLEVYVLMDKDRTVAFERQQLDTDSMSFSAVDLADLSQQLGYKHYPQTHYSDALFSYLLGRNAIRNHYAGPAHLRGFRAWQMAQGLRAAAWLVAVGGSTLAGMNTVDGMLMQEEKIQIEQATAQITDQYHKATNQLPIEPSAALAMRDAIRFADTVQARDADLDHLFRITGKAFANQPNLAMKKFDWFLTQQPTAVSLSDLGDDNMEGFGPARYLVSSITGHLRNFDGSFKRAHEQIEALSSWLARQPDVVESRIVRNPLETRADAALQGSVTKNGDDESAEFELRIVLELKDETV